MPLLALVVFGGCAATGALLWLRSAVGHFLAPLLLSAQLIHFRVGDSEYLFSVGAGLFVGVDTSALVITGRLGSRLIAGATEPPQELTVLLNLVPIVLLAALLSTPPPDGKTAV